MYLTDSESGSFWKGQTSSVLSVCIFVVVVVDRMSKLDSPTRLPAQLSTGFTFTFTL